MNHGFQRTAYTHPKSCVKRLIFIPIFIAYVQAFSTSSVALAPCSRQSNDIGRNTSCLHSKVGAIQTNNEVEKVQSHNVKTTSFILTKEKEQKDNKKENQPEQLELAFNYEYNELIVGAAPSVSPSTTETVDIETTTTLVLLIQPIGVGIGKWYYNRLLNTFATMDSTSEKQLIPNGQKMVFLAPDLIGCGTASNPKITTKSSSGEIIPNSKRDTKVLPLFEVNDWCDQMMTLMADYESKYYSQSSTNTNISWCVVSNGGCVPIALEIAKRYALAKKKENKNDSSLLTNLILSATPSISALLRPTNKEKALKSYKTLTGITGKLFWWYSLRNNGAFIQKFSEKNLAACAENLGDDWTPTCVETGRVYKKSRYSTFAFLAGSLNGGSKERLDTLENVHTIAIDVISGGDKTRNAARSWFWEKRKNNVESTPTPKAEEIVRDNEPSTVAQYLREKRSKCTEIIVGGRRCPAHEDSPGFAEAVITLISSS